MSEMVQTASSILINGGDFGAYKRVTSVGADLSVPDTWHDIAFRIDSDLGFEQPNEDIELESGVIGNTVPGKYKFDISVTSAQLDAALINFINNETVDTYFALFFDAGKGQNGFPLELFVAIGKIERSLKWQGKSRKPVWRFTGINNPSAVTPATLPSWAYGDAGDFAVAARKQFVAKETDPAA
mgnify:CR=1 FL=1